MLNIIVSVLSVVGVLFIVAIVCFGIVGLLRAAEKWSNRIHPAVIVIFIFVCVGAAVFLGASEVEDERLYAYNSGYADAENDFDTLKTEAYLQGFADGKMQAQLGTRPVPGADYSTSDALDELNDMIDNLKSGDMQYNGNDDVMEDYETWKEYHHYYEIIENMFRDITREDIRGYLSAVYNLETDLYPIEYFKKLGYTYTGDVIDGWTP